FAAVTGGSEHIDAARLPTAGLVGEARGAVALTFLVIRSVACPTAAELAAGAAGVATADCPDTAGHVATAAGPIDALLTRVARHTAAAAVAARREYIDAAAARTTALAGATCPRLGTGSTRAQTASGVTDLPGAATNVAGAAVVCVRSD